MAVIILESFQTRQIERPDTTYKSVLAHGKKVTKVHLCMFISKIPNGISSALLSGNYFISYSSFEEEVPVVFAGVRAASGARVLLTNPTAGV